MAYFRFRTRITAVPGAVAALVAALVLPPPRSAAAAEATRVVATHAGEGEGVDLNLSLSWLHDAKSTSVKREYQSMLSPGRTELVKDLRYAQTRDVLRPRLDFGFKDLGLHVELPIVLNDSRGMDFDQTGGNCIFPGGVDRPTCVNQSNSSTLRDGFLPGYGTNTYGFDARHNRPFTAPSTGVFRGPDRSGIESLNFGAVWAIFNQFRDDTKPTWTVGFDARIDVAKDMAYDPANPGANTAVGLGFHQLLWSTAVSHRFRYFDPYFSAYYMLPVTANGSAFSHYTPGSQTNIDPQQVAGITFGTEHILWEHPGAKQKVALEYRGRIEGRFEGRAHSEMWEVFSGSSACKTSASACRPGIDQDLNGDGKPDPFPGVTDTESYGVFGGDLGLNVQVGPFVRFRGLFGLTVEQPHFITFADAGKDLNGDGRVQTDDPNEANPVYREVFDLPGRRYRVDGTQIWSLFIDAAIMF